jgi:PhzF family phenazine biosynthesis protein
MQLTLFQADAFANQLFTGNPAGVIPLDAWLPDAVMQQIAMENNLAETAFFVPFEDHFHIRWFTPVVEVDLCGHATMATAHVMFSHLGFQGQTLRFESRSGVLQVESEGELLTLDFPEDEFHVVDHYPELIGSLNVKPLEILKGKTDYMVVVATQEEVVRLEPDLNLLARIPGRGVIVTAPGDEVDFVSRFFAPQSGIPEDPVTGSAHTTLTPYWAKELGKTELSAMQLSPRKGWLQCKLSNGRVRISGKAFTYLKGEIFL